MKIFFIIIFFKKKIIFEYKKFQNYYSTYLFIFFQANYINNSNKIQHKNSMNNNGQAIKAKNYTRCNHQR